MESERYHLRELEIAQDPRSTRHLLPPISADDRDILDIGCGAGQTLIASKLSRDQRAVGVDVDASALSLGNQLDGSLFLICAGAERLPFAADVFDVAIARVSLPYTDIPAALREIRRVLKPDGRCWLTLHPMSMGINACVRHVLRGQFKGALFQLYALLNGLSLHLLGRLFAFPFATPRRMESCQTQHGMERALRASGFETMQVQRGRHFVVTARRARIT